MTELILSYLPALGPWLLALTTFLSCLAVPVPSSLMMIAAGGIRRGGRSVASGGDAVGLWRGRAGRSGGVRAWPARRAVRRDRARPTRRAGRNRRGTAAAQRRDNGIPVAVDVLGAWTLGEPCRGRLGLWPPPFHGSGCDRRGRLGRALRRAWHRVRRQPAGRRGSGKQRARTSSGGRGCGGIGMVALALGPLTRAPARPTFQS